MSSPLNALLFTETPSVKKGKKPTHIYINARPANQVQRNPRTLVRSIQAKSTLLHLHHLCNVGIHQLLL